MKSKKLFSMVMVLLFMMNAFMAYAYDNEPIQDYEIDEYDISYDSNHSPELHRRFIVKIKDADIANSNVVDSIRSFSLNTSSLETNDVSGDVDESEVQVNINEWTEDYEVLEFQEEMDEDTFIDYLSENESIEYVQPVYDFSINEVTDDDIIEISENVSLSEASLETNELSTGNRTVVALIDTGVDITHPELQDKLWLSGTNSYGWNVIDDNETVYDKTWGNDMAHGTHLAGIISGKSSLDTASIVNNQIMVIRAFQNGKSNTVDLVNAIQYAISNGARIINCSWGSPENDLVLREIIESNPEVLFICSGGNGGTSIDETPIYPACYDLPNIISVASVNDDMGLSYYSNYGTSNVDIAAYGRNVESLFPDNRRGILSGTSVANAYVTRVISEVVNGYDEWSVSEILNRIYSTSDKLSSLTDYVCEAKMINLNNALINLTSSEIRTVDYTADVIRNTEIDEKTSWELFNANDNLKIETTDGLTVLLKNDGTVWTAGESSYMRGVGSDTTIKSAPTMIASLNGVIDISVSENHCLALKSDGTVWAWGGNSSGQLGISGNTASYIPVQVVGLNNIICISAGYDHSMAVDTSQNVWTWGSNEYGQLGRSGTTGTAGLVSSLSNVRSVSAGYGFSIAIDNNNYGWGWGHNHCGQLGIDSNVDQSSPVQVIKGTFLKISAGNNHCLAINTENKLMGWGVSSRGQLGQHIDYMSFYPVEYDMIVKDVSAGYDYSLVVTDSGNVLGCGSNDYGQLGNNSLVDSTVFSEIPLNNISNISAGYRHSAAIDNLGHIYTWGSNDYGQLADGRVSYTYKPGYTGVSNAVDIAAGFAHNLVLDSYGDIWAWGLNNMGQLGRENVSSSSIPEKIAIGNDETDIVDVECGYHHSIALDSDGNVWAWGYNNYGQLGEGTSTKVHTPTKISGLSDVVSVSPGFYHNLALKSDGTVWAWGKNTDGQLGDGTTESRTTPEQISGLDNVIAVSGGYGMSMALKSDGTVWTWGDNFFGELGLGTDTDVYVPTKIESLSDIKMIQAGRSHAIAISESGAMYAWGDNPSGQLGDGTYIESYEPIVNNVDFDVACISFMKSSVVSVDTGGNVIAWGDNIRGQLGFEDISDVNTPTATGITNISKIISGFYHTIAIDNDGQVLTWGLNNLGQLGDGSFLKRLTPYCIGEFESVNNTMDNAKKINTDIKLYLSMDGTDNSAWYSFVPKYSGLYIINITDGYSVELYKKTFGVTENVDISNATKLIYPNEYYLKITAESGGKNFALEISGGDSKTIGKAFETVILDDEYYSNIKDNGKLYKNHAIVENTAELNSVTWLCNFNNILYFNAASKLNKLTDTSYAVVGAVDARYTVSDGSNIYFSNWSDSGRIYKGTLNTDGTMTFTKMCNDSAMWLSIDGEYIYYKNAFDNGKTYRILKSVSEVQNGELAE